MTGTAGSIATRLCDTTVFTLAQLIALRDAAGLTPGCPYRVTVPAQAAGSLGITVAEVMAVTAGELALAAEIDSTMDNASWAGLLDLDLGFYTEVRDNRGNRVVDTDDGATIGSFPWGSTNFADNVVRNSVLTGWAAQGGLITGCRVEDTTVNLTGKTAGALIDSVISGGSVTVTGGLALTRSELLDTVVLVSAASVIVTDSVISASTITKANAQSNVSILNSRVTDSTLTLNRSVVKDCDIAGSTLLNRALAGAGLFGLSPARCRIWGTTITNDTGRHLLLNDCDLQTSTITFTRTNTANADQVNGLTMRESTLTMSGPNDWGAPVITAANSVIEGGSTVNLGSPQNSQASQLVNSRVSGGSTLNVNSPGRFLNGRVDLASTVNAGSGTQNGVVIESGGVTTLTAANTAKGKYQAAAPV